MRLLSGGTGLKGQPRSARKKKLRRRREEPLVEILDRCLKLELTPGVTALDMIISRLMANSLAGNKQAKRLLLRYQQKDIPRREPKITLIGGFADKKRQKEKEMK